MDRIQYRYVTYYPSFNPTEKVDADYSNRRNNHYRKSYSLVTGFNKIIKNLLISIITSLEHKSFEIREDVAAISYIHKTK